MQHVLPAMSRDISGEFPFRSNYFDIQGSKIHYIDDGSGIRSSCAW